MRPRLYDLVTEQLRTVQQQIAECQVLERQLAQVLHRLQTTAPVSHANGCQCLGSETSEAQEPHLYQDPERRSNVYLHLGTIDDSTPFGVVRDCQR